MLNKLTAVAAVLGTAGNLILLAIIISGTFTFHKSLADEKEIQHVNSDDGAPCPQVSCPQLTDAVEENALENLPDRSQQQLIGRVHCPFNHETDWDALPVPKCANDGEASSFLMVFMGESGSSALQWGTMRHSRIFEKNETGGASFAEMELIENWNDEKVSELDRIKEYFAMADQAGKIPGFKVRPGHLDALTKIMPLYKPRFIWNYRRNTLAKAVGILRKGELGKPNGGYDGNSTWAQECRKTGSCKVKIDIEALLSRISLSLSEEQNLFLTLESLQADCVLPVSYEEFDECPDRVFAQIYKFLGLPYQYHPPKFNKLSPDNLCQSIENWDDVCTAIMPCRDLRWQLNSHFSCKCNNLDFKRQSNMTCPLKLNL